MAFDIKDADLMTKRTSDLKPYYKYVYKCAKCNYHYGNDLPEKPKQIHMCPICEEAFTNRKRFA